MSHVVRQLGAAGSRLSDKARRMYARQRAYQGLEERVRTIKAMGRGYHNRDWDVGGENIRETGVCQALLGLPTDKL